MRNEDALVDLKTTGDEMLEAKHYAHDRITAALELITAQWDFLKMKTDEKKKRLAEALELLVFDREADEVGAWIASKTLIANVEDVGKVYKLFLVDFNCVFIESSPHEVYFLFAVIPFFIRSLFLSHRSRIWSTMKFCRRLLRISSTIFLRTKRV